LDNITTTSKRIHPLVATAAISLILVSLVGVAAITGLLPNSHGTGSPAIESPAPLAQLTPDDKLANDVKIVQAPQRPVYEAPPQHKTVIAQAPSAPTRVIQPDGDRYNDRNNYSEPARREQYREPVRVAAICNSCGRVETVSAIQHEAPQQTSGLGVAAGAVLGGLLGNQVGGGNGRTLATVAGAVGGGVAGNEVERRTRHGSTTYQVRVRMDDGSIRSFPYSSAPNWNAGDHVQVVNGHLSNRG
jgi:outer membrane lipoprotein SlyB